MKNSDEAILLKAKRKCRKNTLSTADDLSFFRFMKQIIAELEALDKTRTAEAYMSAMNSFRKYLKKCSVGASDRTDITLSEIDTYIILEYDLYLRKNGICANTSSFYMRILRAVYNRAVERELVAQRSPFRYVYTGVEKTPKRAVTLDVIRQLKEMDLSDRPALDFARDMFLFSFYTRGMSFIDMAYLKKSDLRANVLGYRRRKTGQQLYIRWEKCMQEIVDKYDTTRSKYLLPIIKSDSSVDERRQYLYGGHNVNRHIKTIGERLMPPQSLTMYVARHSWASIARSKNIPLSVISEGMGHESEKTTRIYLASLDSAVVDNANSLILQSLYNGI